ncbi:MAG TPA: phage holin family protein [Candidatus Angelobacter sp.]|nr:phage holin family protein [Candidatus Angelobacter sp.]
MVSEKSIGTVVSETKQELKEFIQTRIAILKSEFAEKARTWKYSIPMLLLAGALLLAAWIVLTFALVALLAGIFFPSPYSWLFGALIVGVAYLLVGGTVGWFAYSELSSVGVAPQRTMEVLKQDQVWIQNEARTA